MLALTLSACGGDGDDSVTPVLDQIAPAVAAIEAELGGPQKFFEINATPQLVNVFVATDGATSVSPYVYVGGELAPAADPAGAEGPTFGSEALSFDPDAVLDGVMAELPDADIVRLVVAGGPRGAVQYTADVRSDDGGGLQVVIAADGEVLSVDPVITGALPP